VQIVVNGQPREVAERITIAQMLAETGVEPRYCAVEVNCQLVPRGEHAARHLQAGDRLEVVTLVGGG